MTKGQLEHKTSQNLIKIKKMKLTLKSNRRDESGGPRNEVYRFNRS